jgi:TPR repeat protein
MGYPEGVRSTRLNFATGFWRMRLTMMKRILMVAFGTLLGSILSSAAAAQGPMCVDPAARCAARGRTALGCCPASISTACLTTSDSCMTQCLADPPNFSVCHTHGSYYLARAVEAERGSGSFGNLSTAELSERGLRLLSHACEHGSLFACETIAIFHADRRDFRSEAQARQVMCDRGDWDACCGIATTLMRGHRAAGIEADPARGVELTNRGCEAGSDVCCANRGSFLERGSESAQIAADPAAARALFEQVCDHRAEDAEALASYLEAGRPARPTDLNLLRDWDRAAARAPLVLGFSTSACASLGGMREAGEGGPVDLPGAFVAFDRACTMSQRRESNFACQQATRLREHAPPAPRGRARPRR